MNSLAERAAKTDTVAQWERISKLADNQNLTNADYGDCDLERLTRRMTDRANETGGEHETRD